MAHTKYRAEEEGIIKEDDTEEIAIVTTEIGDDDIGTYSEVFDEDNEDTHKNLQVACAQERQRARSLTILEKQAKNLGVSFDAAKAIENGTSLEKARYAVLMAAASKSASLKVSPYVPHQDGNNKVKINAKWENAWKAVNGRK
ncbi:hypothetical protein V4B17_03575 [Bartonella sp. B23]